MSSLKKRSVIVKKGFCLILVSLISWGQSSMFAEPVSTGNPLQSEENVANRQPDFSGWKTAKTKHFKFIYEDAYRPIAERYAYFADEAWAKIAESYSTPQEMTEVFVTARTNTVNAFTYFTPPEIVMFNTPVVTPEFGFRDSWEKTFFTHELIHVANITFEDKKYIGSKVFGEYFRGMNYSSIPGWAMEGLTTVLETKLTDGGRGRSPYFELNYKAPTLDNGFISYDEIGLEKDPPYGQAYVMGYLIMRSIADRWGYSALADIERNRTFGMTWEDSVKLVTGERAEDIYKDVRIALAKKYAKERSIPEGKIISNRDVGTFHYKPAIVMDDGTLIGLRTRSGMSPAVVRLDPSAREGTAYLEQTFPELDLNTVPSETILFEADFSDETSVTCDENGKVYASLSSFRSDRKPGQECFNDIYSWTEEEGLIKLTDSGCMFQPSVSRDGSTLIAVEHHGLRMRLVSIDPATLRKQVVLESDIYDFIQPAVNDDGTKIAFLACNDTRAKVCFIEKGDTDFVVLANGEGAIYDPAYPSWNSDGKLTFACNYRGRLEVFEIEQTEFAGMDEESEFVYVPVVSDPIGATWAYRTERGIYYSSTSSTGDVLKMKPLSEWGIVPSFEGPSLSGKIICFGDLEDDYPDFNPYFIPSEVETTGMMTYGNEMKLTSSQVAGEEDESPYQETNDSDERTASIDDGIGQDETSIEEIEEPVPVHGKYVAHRDFLYEDRAAWALENEVQRELGPERNYVPGIRPVAYFPMALVQKGLDDENVWSVGYNIVFSTPRLQMNQGYAFADIYWIPKWNNVSGGFNMEIPVSNSTVDLLANRTLLVDDTSGMNRFRENNSLLVGFTSPIYSRAFNYLAWDIVQFYETSITASRSSDSMIPIDSDMAYDFTSSFQAGVDMYWTDSGIMESKSLNQTYALIGDVDWNDLSFAVGAEGILNYKSYGSLLCFELEGGLRYLYGTKESLTPSYSGVKFVGQPVDCTYPLNFVFKAGLVIPDFILGTWHLNESARFCAGKEIGIADFELFKNVGLSQKLVSSLEIDLLEYGRNRIQLGISESFNISTLQWEFEDFYINVKYNWLRI